NLFQRQFKTSSQIGDCIGQHLQNGDSRIVRVVISPQVTGQLLDILLSHFSQERKIEVVAGGHVFRQGNMFVYFWHISSVSTVSLQVSEARESSCCLAETRMAIGVSGLTKA